MISSGIFLVAFVALMVLSDYTVSAAVFLAIFPAIAAAIVLYRGFASPAAVPAPVEHAAPRAMPSAAPEPAPAPEATPAAPAAPAAAPDAPSDHTKPALYDTPGEGGADDLKKIKGVGPKMEQMPNGMGVWHYSQVAGWGPSEVAWVDDNLEGFKGRVSRDNWVEQAKTLAAGGETDFSKKVDEGEVY
jgi:NADH-quinone oxidoreductase subunit E